MKKVFSVLTVAVLAVSTVFAGFSGSASIGVGANFDNGNFGFLSQGSGVDVNVELSTATGEAKGEGDVYASIKGSLSVTLLNDEAEKEDDDPFKNVYKGSKVGILAKVSEAKIAGENWSISILGMPGNPDYAKSAIDGDWAASKDAFGRVIPGAYYWKPLTYKTPYAKTNGVTVDVFGYKAGLGLMGDFAKDKENNILDFSAFVETPAYDLNGFSIQAAATYAFNEAKLNDNGEVVAEAVDKKSNAMGLHAKFGYANDVLSASVATDMGVDFANDNKFDADVAASFAYDFVSVDAYYMTDDYVSVSAGFDLNSFDVPVAISLMGIDLVNDQYIGAEVATTPIEGLKVSVNGGYGIADKAWDTGLNVEYKNDLLKTKAGLSVAGGEGKEVLLGAEASVETTSLIPGAKLGLAWSDAKDLLNKYEDKSNYGKIMATVGIEF